MKVFVINLDRNPERLVHCVEQFAYVGVPFERVAAVDGRSLDRNFIESLPSNPNWPKPHMAEFGCFMSHKECWKKLVESTDDYAVVFEDDMVLSADAGKFLKLTDWFPRDADLLKLETFKTKTYFDRWYQSKILGRQIWKALSFHAGTGAYIISRKLAAKLLVETENYMPAPIDHYLFDPIFNSRRNVSIFQLAPAICAQELVLYPQSAKLGSSIDNRSVKDMIQSKRGTLTGWQKFTRELGKGLSKLMSIPFRKRRVVDFL